jgi:putative membrane protein
MYPWGWLAIAAVVIVGVTLAIILSVRRKRQSQRDDALETLKLRYVKGELSEEDYLKMKEVVGK